jgi:hypothetical protein
MGVAPDEQPADDRPQRQALRRPDIGRDPRFLTPELRQRNLAALHAIVQDWIRTFADLKSLDARDWNAVRVVPDRSGGEIRIPGRPWRFHEPVGSDDDQQVPARQGEHNSEVLAELGFGPAEITKIGESGALAAWYNSRGHYDDAIEWARRVTEPGLAGATGPALPELIEAARRIGDLAAAADALRQLTDRVALARSRPLLYTNFRHIYYRNT